MKKNVIWHTTLAAIRIEETSFLKKKMGPSHRLLQ
jgi:hypothetical protein